MSTHGIFLCMNIHPLFVHFPIGMLVVYSALEIGAYLVPQLRRQAWVFPVKAFLLFAGVLSAIVALATGGIAEDLIAANPRAFILELHAPFAVATTLVYLILAASYTVRIFDQNGWSDRIVGSHSFLVRILNIKRYLSRLVLDTWVLPFLALLGLILLTITGGLGAAIVYGPNIDPAVSFVYHLFWAN